MQPDPADVGAPDAPEVPAGAGPAGAGYCWEAYRDGVRDGLERGKLGLSALLAETMEAQKGFLESREQNCNTVRRGVLLDLIADKVRPAMATRDFEVAVLVPSVWYRADAKSRCHLGRICANIHVHLA